MWVGFPLWRAATPATKTGIAWQVRRSAQDDSVANLAFTSFPAPAATRMILEVMRTSFSPTDVPVGSTSTRDATRSVFGRSTPALGNSDRYGSIRWQPG